MGTPIFCGGILQVLWVGQYSVRGETLQAPWVGQYCGVEGGQLIVFFDNWYLHVHTSFFFMNFHITFESPEPFCYWTVCSVTCSVDTFWLVVRNLLSNSPVNVNPQGNPQDSEKVFTHLLRGLWHVIWCDSDTINGINMLLRVRARRGFWQYAP